MFCYIYRKQSSGTQARLCVRISEESVYAKQHNQELTSSVFSNSLSNRHHFPILYVRKQGQRAYKNIHMASFQFLSGIGGKLRPRPGSVLNIYANVINCKCVE